MAKKRKALWFGLACLAGLFLFGCGKRQLSVVPSVEVPGALVCESETAEVPALSLHAQSAVLMDADTGRILYGKDSAREMPMASTTKIMTCILALELAEPERVCKVSSYAASMPEVHLGVRAGEAYRLKDLLYSLMLESHNDTAVVIAEAVAGSVEAFAARMNEKAREIGAFHTHFVTPNGLDGADPQGEHRTTAADLARLLRYCIGGSSRSASFLEITQARTHTFSDVTGKQSHTVTNKNAFLDMMEGAMTGKTGYTGKAGYCYVGALSREGETYIVSLLACGWPNHKQYKWEDTRKLMEYGLSHYEKRSLFDAEALGETWLPDIRVKGGTAPEVSVFAEGVAEALVKEGEKAEVSYWLTGELEAPLQEDTLVGEVIVRLGEVTLAVFPLRAAKAVPAYRFADSCKEILCDFFLQDRKNWGTIFASEYSHLQ